MTTDKKIANDATASVSGTIYQLCVALDRAFMLEEGQKIWIEKFGDVTISGLAQLETKHYSDTLTDSHLNFWSTLKNWLLPPFSHNEYANLVLFTTQTIGESSKLQEWNSANPVNRLELLKSVNKAAEERFQKSRASGKNTKNVPPSLIDQRFVLDDSRRPLLEQVIPKISISSDSPGIEKLRKKILDIHGKLILHAKRDDFLNGLIGYLLDPSTVQNGWEITYDEFSAKVAMLTNLFRRGTVVFPSKYSFPKTDQSPEAVELHKEKRFVKKLYEIEHRDVVSEAISHYLAAHLTVIEEFKNYEVDPASYQTYENNLKQSQQTKHRIAKRKLAGGDPISASQNFYDDLTGEYPQPFPSFEQTPIEFRNGVFHMLADNESDEFQWKLWE
ncbi:MAG: hypothetical protein ABIG70_08105 [Pseudomonadota bacterium]